MDSAPSTLGIRYIKGLVKRAEASSLEVEQRV